MFNFLNDAGRIPAHNVCPFKGECPIVSSCRHQGIDHPVEYSCAAARALDMIIGDEDTHLKSNTGNSYLVLEGVKLSAFQKFAGSDTVRVTSFGHYDPISYIITKDELLQWYHVVSKKSIPQ